MVNPQVLQLFKDCKYRECIEYLIDNQSDSMSLEDKKLLAKCYLLLSNFSAAIQAYLNLLSVTSDVEISCNLARCYLAVGETHNALKYYKSAESMSSNTPAVLKGLAIAYSEKEHHSLAIEYSKKFHQHFNGDLSAVASLYYNVYWNAKLFDLAEQSINDLGFNSASSIFLSTRIKSYIDSSDYSSVLTELGDFSGWNQLEAQLLNFGLYSLLCLNLTSGLLVALESISHDSISLENKRAIAIYLSKNNESTALISLVNSSLESDLSNSTYFLVLSNLMLEIEETDLAISLGLRSFALDDKNHVSALHLAISYGQKHDFHTSLRYAQISNSLNPSYPQAKLELVNIYAKLGDDAKACLFCLDLIESGSLTDKAFTNLASLLERLDYFNIALDVLNLPNCNIPEPAKVLHRATLLRKAGDSDQALQEAQQAVVLNPDLDRAWATLSAILWDLGFENESLEASLKSLSLGDCIDAWNNSASIQTDLGNFSEASNCIEKVLSINPLHSNCNFLKGCRLLMNLDFVNGWKHYAHRTKSYNTDLDIIPVYNGQSSGKLLVLAEQGIGDEITFAQTYVDILNNNSISVVIECDDRLRNMFERSFSSECGRIEFVDRNKYDCTDFDFYILTGDLMALHRSSLADFSTSSSGYLLPPSIVQPSISSLRKSGRKLIGLSWKTKLKRHMNRKNCIDLIEMLRPLKDADVDFVCLQYGDVDSDINRVKDELGISIMSLRDVDLYNDIDSLSALICECDFVYTTPNITVGLSGALGKQTHLLLPFGGPRWRWGTSSGKSYMFDGVCIHRQDPDTGNWEDPINSACSMLL